MESAFSDVRAIVTWAIDKTVLQISGSDREETQAFRLPALSFPVTGIKKMLDRELLDREPSKTGLLVLETPE